MKRIEQSLLTLTWSVSTLRFSFLASNFPKNTGKHWNKKKHWHETGFKKIQKKYLNIYIFLKYFVTFEKTSATAKQRPYFSDFVYSFLSINPWAQHVTWSYTRHSEERSSANLTYVHFTPCALGAIFSETG